MRFPTLKEKVLSLLAEEIEGYLPQFEPHSSDFQMVSYAYRDLKEWLKCKWGSSNRQGTCEKSGEILERDPEAFKAFLNYWIGLWLEKWRDRVKVLLTKPKPPPEVMKRIREARKTLRNMEHRKELKRLLVQKLIWQGEICMPGFIAEQLIIEEITKRSKGVDGSSEIVMVLPFDILNSISYRISRLTKEKGPLVYLNLNPHTP